MDLYDNLENYNDENIIEELRNENKDLKFKLEERTAALTKLQKDFDILTAEYKKLELNYSSLLKTARAEVERKAQIITNLNIEKDMMVLSTIKNKNVLNIRRNMPFKYDNSRRKCETDAQNKYKAKELSDTSKPRSSSAGRKEACHKPPDDTIPALCSEQQKSNSKSLVDKVSEKSKAPHDQVSDSKENISCTYKQKDVDKCQPRPGGIRSRRKSMPAVSFKHDKLSSDEEYEDSSSTTEAKRKELPPKESCSWRTQDKSNNNKQDCKEPDNFYRSNRNYDSDRYRSKDRYDYPYKLRRHFSPERLHRKPPRDHIEDRNRRFEYSRHRAADSPPRDKFYHQSNKSHYEREYRDFERNPYQSYHHQERLSVKHKMSSDYDEPSNKRPRNDSHHRHSEDESRLYRQKEPSNVHSIAEVIQNAEDMSCQSPDYMLTESVPTQPIREIKSIALTALEDPRENSKRYVIRTEHGKKMLSTVAGRNVDMKPVDKLLWNMKQVKIPDALVHGPFHDTDELVKQIYMDVDNPVSNMSMESGEIPFIEDVQDHSINHLVVHNVLKNSESTDKNQKSKQPTKNEIPKKSKEPKYIIPKVKKIENTKTSLPFICVSNRDSIIHKNNAEGHELEIGEHISPGSDTNKDPVIHTQTKQHLRDTLTHSNTDKGTVEGDLELSDESSDNILHKPDTADKIQGPASCDAIIAKKEIDVSPDKLLDNPKSDTSKSDRKSKKANSKKKLSVDKTVGDCGNTSKKNKTKRKAQKQKGDKEILKVSETENELDKNTTAEQKENTVSKEIKSKFCDLFGDSSSLITPEDLGLTALQRQVHLVSSPNYVPIFEDAQDAIDLPTKDKQVQQQTSEPEVTIDKATHVTQTKSTIKTSKSLDTKKTQSKKNEDKPISLSTAVDLNLINNEIQNSTKESDVVKTVIISSGVQQIPTCVVSRPECLLDNSPNYTNNAVNTLLKINSQQSQNYVHTTPETLIEALATSTPAKVPPSRLQPGTPDFVTSDVSNNSLEMKSHVGNITPAIDNTSDSNTVGSQNNDDVPDVRIFVRRRRGKKKATPSKS